MELEIRECHVRAGQLHRALEREVGQTLDPAELVLAGQLLVERLNVDLEADVFPKPLCPIPDAVTKEDCFRLVWNWL